MSRRRHLVCAGSFAVVDARQNIVTVTRVLMKPQTFEVDGWCENEGTPGEEGERLLPSSLSAIVVACR